MKVETGAEYIKRVTGKEAKEIQAEAKKEATAKRKAQADKAKANTANVMEPSLQPEKKA